MGDLTANFDRSEYDRLRPVPREYEANVRALAPLVQWVRDLVGVPGIIGSVWRSREYNAQIGGAPNSAHVTAEAADVTFIGATDYEIVSKAMAAVQAGTAPRFGLIMVYDNSPHVHIGLPRGSQLRQFLRRTSSGDIPLRTRADLEPLKKKPSPCQDSRSSRLSPDAGSSSDRGGNP